MPNTSRDLERQPLHPPSENNLSSSNRQSGWGSPFFWKVAGTCVMVGVGGAIVGYALYAHGSYERLCVQADNPNPIVRHGDCPQDYDDCGDYNFHKVCSSWCAMFADQASHAVKALCSHLPGPPSPIPPG